MTYDSPESQLIIMRNAIWDNIFRNKEERLSETAFALRQVPIFGDLSKKELREIERLIHQREYTAGEVVFHQSDPSLGMYIIVKGRVQIANNEDPDNRIVYSELSDGDFFGDMALVDDATRSASALATEDTRLIAFFRTELKDILTRLPKLGNKILLNLGKVTAQRLRKTNELLLEAQKISKEPS
ncbi:MAG: cyclic nucleotide-binding domain-containing protein [Candidatus Marinimicrobia bacterium]|nr:cyclic nucleotide-binding domain-containing protein [Candidatus Neomarinimicrobiota bacterium]